jgi:hypothetical protein
VLTPRRVALAAAEACWEGLLGLPPVKKSAVSRFSRRARWSRHFRYYAVAYPWWSWWWQTLSIVGVVFVGTVAGEVVVASRGTKSSRGRRNSIQSHNETTEIARTWHAGCLRHETSLQMNKVLEYIQLHTFDYHTQHIFRLYVHHARCMSLHEPD